MIRYLVKGGYVLSRDGDKNYISAKQVMSMYGIPRAKCSICDEQFLEGAPNIYKDLCILSPKQGGNYCIRTALEKHLSKQLNQMHQEFKSEKDNNQLMLLDLNNEAEDHKSQIKILQNKLDIESARSNKYQQLFSIALSALAVGLSLAFYF